MKRIKKFGMLFLATVTIGIIVPASISGFGAEKAEAAYYCGADVRTIQHTLNRYWLIYDGTVAQINWANKAALFNRPLVPYGSCGPLTQSYLFSRKYM